jgi:sugar transferase EpsL
MKRCFDIFLALFLMALTVIPVLIMCLMAALFNGLPIFFLQKRAGEHGQIFKIYKFRTMISGDAPDNERLIFFGKLLRKTSLDELPQLWNVLRGEMSIVGPRPLLPEYLPLYSERQSRRHEARPGITGWSQVNGRNAPSWEDRLEMDVWYVEHQSFVLDCRIILKTVGKVFAGTGVSAKGQATVEPFRGSQKSSDGFGGGSNDGSA